MLRLVQLQHAWGTAVCLLQQAHVRALALTLELELAPILASSPGAMVSHSAPLRFLLLLLLLLSVLLALAVLLMGLPRATAVLLLQLSPFLFSALASPQSAPSLRRVQSSPSLPCIWQGGQATINEAPNTVLASGLGMHGRL